MSLLERYLPIADLYWEGDTFRPAIDAAGPAELAERLARIEGQFSLAVATESGVMLARDKHGVNKLFYAIREDGSVIAANYIADLVDRGVPFSAVFSVPSGRLTHVEPHAARLSHTRYYELPSPSGEGIEHGAREIREALETWFARMAASLRGRPIRLCLSGGLDSSVIAALAVRHFPDVTAYTYSFIGHDNSLSEDAVYARRVAERLGLGLELVLASADTFAQVVESALVWGQDWRDFNVHCAVVNEILARAMADDAPAPRPLVLTGDMMNEIVADYTPIGFAGTEYYKLPRLEPERLRRILVRGLDAGDREVGVFARHGLDLVQPYGMVLDHYMRVPLTRLGEGGKQRLVREVAGDLLPAFVLERKKVRAQIGTSAEPTGILPEFARLGWDSHWLAATWCRRFNIQDSSALAGFIRGGVYRTPSAYPSEGPVERGYLTR